MPRVLLTDSVWEQIQATMTEFGCKHTKNARHIMEAIVWKLRTGAPWRDIPKELCPWQTAFNKFNRWAEKGLWNNFFLLYEEKLIRSGFSSTEVTSKLTNMRVELGLEGPGPLDYPEEDELLRFTFSPTRMETRLILKSLGVKSTIPKLRDFSSTKSQVKTSLPTKATTPTKSGKKRG